MQGEAGTAVERVICWADGSKWLGGRDELFCWNVQLCLFLWELNKQMRWDELQRIRRADDEERQNRSLSRGKFSHSLSWKHLSFSLGKKIYIYRRTQVEMSYSQSLSDNLFLSKHFWHKKWWEWLLKGNSSLHIQLTILFEWETIWLVFFFLGNARK